MGKYQVVKELERIDVSGHKRRYETFGMPPDHSPLRQRHESPVIEAYRGRQDVDQNYRRARESCERIASVLGLNNLPEQPRPTHSSPLRVATEPVSASTSMATVSRL